MPKKSNSVVPKFFCENCQNEVKRNTKVCPHCGRFFASVKCPSCNYFGSSDEFRGGCPSCGYAVIPNNENAKPNSKTSVKLKNNEESLPWWVYAIVFALLGFVILYALLKNS